MKISAAKRLAGYFKAASAAALYGILNVSLAFGGPTGGQVVRGDADIGRAGGISTIRQASDKAVINWEGFSIDVGEAVRFLQPGGSSVTLNRVTGSDLSEIYGALDANGNIFLINPNGILFGRGSEINVGGLVATTHDIADDDFMSGNYAFTIPGLPGSSVVNEGSISIAEGGLAAFVAPHVANNGIIAARLGRIALGSGEAGFSLDLYGDDLIKFAVSDEIARSLGLTDDSPLGVENGGLISADGGTVLLTAETACEIVNDIITAGGEIRARSIEERGGRIILSGNGDGGVRISETAVLDVSGPDGRGGSIEISGRDILVEGSLNASGAAGGGEILVGGDWQGSGNMPQAVNTAIADGAILDASAADNGDGGKIVVWSEIYNPDSITSVNGSLLAKGAGAGTGGAIETSGHKLDIGEGLFVTAGYGGIWLLDPADSTIDQTVADGYVSTLDTGTSVLNEVTGDITLNSGVSIAKTAGGDATLTFKSSGSILLESGSSISSANNRLNLVLWADTDGSGSGSIFFAGTNDITTNGGGIWMGGGSGSTNWIPYSGAGALTVGDSYAVGDGATSLGGLRYRGGIEMSDETNLISNGGNIALYGKSYNASDKFTSGVLSDGGTIDAGAGTILIDGVSRGSVTTNSQAVSIADNAVYIKSSNATADAIRITGDASGTTAGTAAIGINMPSNGGTIQATGGGDITLSGTGGAAGWSPGFQMNETNVLANSGAISLTGVVSSTSHNAFQAGGGFTIGQKTGTDVTVSSSNITLTGDTVSLGGTDLFAGTGTLTIKPYSSTTTIGLAGGAGVFNLDATELGLIQDGFSNITIGSSTSGAMTVNAQTFTDPLTLLSGGDININGTITLSGTGDDLLIKTTEDIIQSTTNHTTTAGGDITYWADSDDDSDGMISISDIVAINSNGGNITFGGGSDPASDYAWSATDDTGGVTIGDTSAIRAGTGDVSIYGANSTTGNLGYGVKIGALNSTYGITGANITINGIGSPGSGTSYADYGVRLDGPVFGSGNISITGVGGGGSSTGYGNYGVFTNTGGDITATGAGNITITGSSDAAAGYSNQGMQLLGDLTTVSGDITLNGTPGPSVGGSSYGIYANTNAISSSAGGNITLTADYIYTSGTTPTVSTTGNLIIQPKTTAFSTAFDSTLFDFTGATFGSVTIGNATNTATITLGEAMTSSGPVTVYGGDITIGAGIDTTAGTASGDILLKASGDILQNANIGITTTGGDVIYWADSDGDSDGGISLNGASGSTVNIATNGGNLWMGGGSGSTTWTTSGGDSLTVGDGYATDYLRTGSWYSGIDMYYTTIDTGGGDIALYGQTEEITSGIMHEGIIVRDTTIDSGTGAIVLDGKVASTVTNNGSQGVYAAEAVIITSASDETTALSITGINNEVNSDAGVDGVKLVWGVDLSATGTGGISIDGTTAGGGYDVFINDSTNTVLSNSGAISVSGEKLYLGAVTLGQKSGSSVTSSSSPVTLTGDTISFNSTIETTGTLTIQPYNDDFASAFTLPASGLTLSNITGLTIGKSATSADGTSDVGVTTASAATVAGPVNVYGGDITIGADIDTTAGTASGDILLKASGNITQSSSAAITTTGDDVIYWADSDANSDGMIFLDTAAINTNGGHLWMGGGAASGTPWNGLTVGDGYAVGNATMSSGIGINASTINTAGGNIAMYGKGRNGAGAGFTLNTDGIRLEGVNTIDSGTGTIYWKGVAQTVDVTGGTSANGIELSTSGGSVIKSANTTADAIYMYGESANATATNAWGIYSWDNIIEATGAGGGITLEGMGYKNNGVTITSGGSVLAASGPITLTGLGYGSGYYAVQIDGNVGLKAGTDVTSSSSNIIVNGDSYSSNGDIASTGTLTIAPYIAGRAINIGTTGAGTLDIASSYFSSNFTNGFSNITIGSDTAGDITVGGAITYNDPLTLKTAGNITMNTGAGLTGAVAGGDGIKSSLVLWADADATDGGYIRLGQSAPITTNGGGLWLGGGIGTANWTPYSGAASLPVGIGYAQGTTALATGIFIDSGAIATNGGNIAMFGKSATGGGYSNLPDGTQNVSGIYSYYDGNSTTHNYSIDSGTGTILLSALGAEDAEHGGWLGDALYLNGGTMTSAATSGDAITLTGDASAVGSNRGAGISIIGWTANDTNNVSAIGGGNIVLNGTGTSNDTSNYNAGIRLSTYTDISTTNGGNISITADTGDSTAFHSFRLETANSLISSSGNLTIDAGSNKGSLFEGRVVVTGESSFTNAGQDVIAQNTLNDFGGAVSVVSGNNFTLSDANALVLGASTVNGDMTLVTAGAITQTGALDANGAVTITAGSGNDITLDNGSNDFTGDITIVSGKDVSLVDTNDVSMGTVTAAGALTVSSGGDITINNTINTTAGGADGDILLKAAEDIIQVGDVDVTANGGDITYWSDSDDNSSGSIMISPTANSSLTTIVSTSGGNIVMGGGSDPAADYAWNTDSYEGGINIDRYGVLDAGTGDITLNGANTFTAGENGMGIRIYQSSGISGNNITINGQGSANSTAGAYGKNFGVSLDGSNITGTGAVNITGTAGGSNSNTGSNHGVYITSNSSVSAIGSGTVTLTGTGGGNGTDDNNGVKISGTVQTESGSMTLNGTAGAGTSAGITLDSSGSLASTGGDITLTTDTVSLDGDMQSSGALLLEPKTSGTTIGLAGGAGTLSLSAANFTTTFVDGFTSITVGSDTAGDITVDSALTYNDPLILKTAGRVIFTGTGAFNPAGNAVYPAIESPGGLLNNTGVALEVGAMTPADDLVIDGGDGGIDLTGQIDSSTHMVTLISDGDVTDTGSGSIVADKLALKGKGNYTLDSEDNDVGTLAAGNDDLSAIGDLHFKKGASSDLIIGETDPKGIYSSGPIRIETQGILRVQHDIATTDASQDAIILIAGKNDVPGDVSGGLGRNVVIEAIPGSGGTLATITAGAGGRTVIYTGSIANSDNITDFIGSGSGNFRYYSTESVTNFTTPLGTSGNYAIYREGATVSVTANDDNKFYDGLAYSGGNGVIYNGLVNGDSLSGTLTYGGDSQGATDAGDYAITPGGLSSGLGYSIGYVEGTLTIMPASVTVTISGSLTGTVAKAYDGTIAATLTSANYLLTGWIGDDGATVTRTTGTYDHPNAGSGKLVTVNLTGGDYTAWGDTNLSNYTLPTSISGYVGTITAAPLSVTAIPDTKFYDGIAYSGGNGVIYSGFVNGETSTALGGTLGYSGTSQGAIDAGDYTITPTGLTSGNYDITFADASLTIVPATLSVAVSGSLTGIVSKVYDGTDTATLAGGNYLLTGWIGDDGATVTRTTGTYDSANAGSGKLVSVELVDSDYVPTGDTDLGNYTLPTSISGNVGIISAAPLTVTAGDDNKIYDGAAYSGGNGVTYSGFVNGETGSVLGGTLAYAGTSQGATDAGAYGITPSGLTGGNYDITFADGTLTVNKAALTVTAGDDSKIYDGVAYSGGSGVTYSGFVNGETGSVLGGTLAYAGTSQGAVDAGAYGITPFGLTGDNYDITFADGTLTVNKAALTVTANDAGKTYDGVAYSGGNGVTYSGFVNSETGSVLGGVLDYTGTSQGAIDVGTYWITPLGLTSSNYDITFADGTLTIDRAVVTISGSLTGTVSKVYDGTDAATLTGMNFLLTGWADDEGATVTKTTGTYDNPDAGVGKLVTVDLVGSDYAPTGDTNLGNYTLPASISGNVGTITAAPLTVSAGDDGKTYDGQAYIGGNGVMYSGFVNSEDSSVLGGTLGYAGTSQGATDAGSYAITPNGLTSGNYAITFADGTLTVNKADATVTANSDTVTYNGLAQSVTGFTAGGLVNGETIAVLDGVSTSGGSGTNAGSYAHTADGTDENYNLTFVDGLLTVSPASLIVTANDDGKRYDGRAYSGGNGVTYSGFVNSETSSVLGGVLDYAGTSQGAIDVGTYGITPGGLTSLNYNISFMDGALTIAAATTSEAGEPPLAGTDGGAGTDPTGGSDDGNVGTFTGGGGTGGIPGAVTPLPDMGGTGGTGGTTETGGEADETTGEESGGMSGGEAPGTGTTTVTGGTSGGTTEGATETGGEAGETTGEESDGTPPATDGTSDDTTETGDISGSSPGAGGFPPGFDGDPGTGTVRETTEEGIVGTGIGERTGTGEAGTSGGTTETGGDAAGDVEGGMADTGEATAGEEAGSTGGGDETAAAGEGEAAGTEDGAAGENAAGEAGGEVGDSSGASGAQRELPRGEAAVDISDGTVSMTFSDGTRIAGISMPDISIAMDGETLLITRERPAGSGEAGMATTLSVVMVKDGEAAAAGGYVVIDGETELSIMPFEGTADADDEPGESLREITFTAFDENGNPIRFTATVSEYDLQIAPQDEVAYKLAEARPDLVLAFAIVELQKQQGFVLEDIETVFFNL